MTGLCFARNRRLSRRAVLRGTGVALSLPWLDAMTPASGRAGEAKGAAESPRRMFAICTNMGILPQFFFPTKGGTDYEPTPYLDILKPYRQQMTICSGVSHPDVDGGHPADNCFLTAAPHPARGGFRTQSHSISTQPSGSVITPGSHRSLCS